MVSLTAFEVNQTTIRRHPPFYPTTLLVMASVQTTLSPSSSPQWLLDLSEPPPIRTKASGVPDPPGFNGGSSSKAS